MTEQEAKGKWCPFLRGDGMSREAGNYTTRDLGGRGNCLGSGCMAWKWEKLREVTPGVDPMGWPVIESKTDGWCALTEVRR